MTARRSPRRSGGAATRLAGTPPAGTTLARTTLADTTLAGTTLAGTTLAGTTLAGTGVAPPARPLLLTDDPALLDDLLRLTAAAGVEADVATASPAVRALWSDAPLVLLDAAAAEAAVRLGLARRDRLVLVAVAPTTGVVWERAVEVGAQQVAVLPDAEDWLIDELVRCESAGGAPGRVIGVVGGCGGAGASVLSAALALTAVSYGLRCLLVDVDPLGGGAELLRGSDETGGATWPDLAGARGRLSPRALADALPVVGGVALLTAGSAGRPADVRTGSTPEVISAVLDSARLAADVTVVDLPRSPAEPVPVALSRLDVLLLVVPAQLRAVVAAARLATIAAGHCPDLRVVVRGPAPAGLASDDVARALGLPVAGMLRADPLLTAALDRGDPLAMPPRRALARLCSALLADLAPAVPPRSAGHRPRRTA